MKTKLFKSMNFIRCVSGATLNLFRYAAMVVVLLLGVGNAWANSHSTHYGKAVLNNATGNGTVYLSTSASSNSGQVGSSNPGTKDGTSWITWNCGESSSNDSKTYYARGTANAGYYWAGWANDKNATSYTASTTGKTFTKAESTNQNNPTTSTIYGFFKPVTVTGASSNVTINVEDASAVYPTDASARTLSFTTVGSNALTDFTYSPANGTTGKFTFSEWTRVSATQTTVKYQFQGSAGDWGGVNRTIEQNVTLTSQGTGGGSATCKITVKYPNVRITDVTADEIINVTFAPAAATQPGVNKTVVFDVDYCDGTNNFDTPTFSGAGASHFGNITTSYANGKLTVNYTYSGNKEEATHVATLTLKVKDAIGGTDATYGTKSVTITAQNAPIATDDAKVIAADGVTKLYQGTWAGALTEANKAANAGCTLWLLRDVTGLTASQEVKNTMTLDLNSFTLSGTLTSAGGLLKLNTAGKILTITDAVSGGTIRVNGNIDGRIAAVEVLQGSLILTKGDLLAQNANTGTTLANIYAAGVYLGAGATMGMTGGTVTANRTGASGNYCFGIYCAGTGSSASSVNLTGGTVTATFPNGSYAEGVFAAGNSIISNMMVTASSKTTSYALRVEDGHLVVNGGTYTATTTNQEARGLYSLTAPSNKNAVLVNNATFNVTAGTTDARGIWCRSTTTTMSGDPTDANVVLSGVTVNAKTDETTGTTDAYAIMSDAGVCLGIQSGTYTATATTQNTYALHTSGYTAVVNGTFNANSTTRTAFAIYVNGGITAVKAGTFTATATTHEVHATKILANAKLLTYGGTFRGICTNVASDGWATGSQVMSTGTLEAQGGTFIGEINKAGLTAAQTGCACGIYANTGSNVTLSNATLQAKANNKWLNGGATTTYYGTHGLLTKTTNKLTLTNCTISATSAYQYAYGIRALDTPVEIKNCTVSVDTDYPYNYGIYTYGAAKVEAENSTFTCVSQQTYAYGAYVANGTLAATDCKFTVKTLQKNVSSAANNYLRGIYVASGKKVTLNGCTIDAQGNSSVGKEGYGIYVDGSADVDNCTVTVSNINTGAYAIVNSGNTSLISIGSGKFKATATTTGVSTNGTAAAAKQQLYGGYYNTNNNLAKYLPAGYSIETLPSTSTEYGEGYRYAIRPGSNLTPVCKIGSTPYYTLEEALEFVNKNSGTAYTILMTANYTLPAGNYTLPANATLLVPMSGQTTSIGTSLARVTSAVTRSCNVQLTFATGVNITVYGTIETGSRQMSSSGATGYQTGSYGRIHMNEGSRIDMESGSKIYCWGYITGTGVINAKDGSTINEQFELGDFKGGGVASAMLNNSYKVFLVTHYFYQSIEADVIYRPGSQALGYSTAAISSSAQNANGVKIVGETGSGSLFLMDAKDMREDTWLKKEYDPATERAVWTLNSGATLGSLSINISGANMQSANYILPISSQMDLKLNYGDMTLNQSTYFMPGSSFEIGREATLKIPSGKELYFIDQENWVKGYSVTNYLCTPNFSPTRSGNGPRHGMKSDNTNIPDAEFFIHGTVEVTGSFFTSGTGANLHSTKEDAGKVIFKSAAAADKSFYQCNSDCGGSLLSGYHWNRQEHACTSAKLKNGGGTYVATAGNAAGTKYIYKDDQWVKIVTDGCLEVQTISGLDHKYAYTTEFIEVAENAADNAYHDAAHSEGAEGCRYFVYTEKAATSEGCVWWEATKEGEGLYKAILPDHNGKINYYTFDAGSGYWTIKTVTIKWLNTDTDVADYTIAYNTVPKYLDASPTKASTATDYYTWIGWAKGSEEGEFFAKDAELPFATENTTYYAVFETHKYSYAVVFKNYDGSILQTSSWEAGQVPYYLAETDPVKPATAAKIYTFTGWSPAFTAVTGTGQVYTAQFAESDRTYTVQWVNYNGTVLKAEQVKYGVTPSAPAKPTRPNDNYYSYTFNAWSPATSAVTGNQTYTATYNYEKIVTKYAITFKNGSTTVYTQNLKDGETPAFDGTTPTKPADAQYTYTFDGWSATEGGAVLASLPAVSGAAKTYYAHFATTTNAYTIRWKSIDGKQLYETDEDVLYGSTPTYNSSKPTKARQGATVYTFDGWSSSVGGAKIALPSVTSDATYYAHFTDDPVYTVTFDANGHGTAPASQEVVKNQHVIEPSAPTADEWIFNGWYKEPGCTNVWNFASDVITADRTLYAKWTQAVATVTANDVTTPYSTLQTAITAANGKTNAVVTMLQNASVESEVEITAAMTIDLNDKTISSAVTTAATGVFKINASGKTVTIKDNGTGGKISHKANCTGYLYGINLFAGSLNVEGGYIYAENTNTTAGTANRACGIMYADKQTNQASITMSGGTVEAKREKTYVYGISIYTGNCGLTMTGGTVKASGGDGVVRGIYTQGTAVLSNVTVTAEAAITGTNNCHAVFSDKDGNYTINSGTYTATSTSTGTNAYAISLTKASSATTGGSAIVKGGRFSGKSKELNISNGTITLQGGYYVHNTELEAKCADNYHVLPNADATYKYKVAEAYTLTWSTDGDVLTGTYTNGITEVGAAITAPATPTKTGYTFQAWSSEVATTMPAANTTYTATWTINQYTLTVLSDNETMGTVTGGGLYDYNTAHTITASPKPGFKFVKWNDDNTSASREVTVTADVTYTATFDYDIANYTVKHWLQNINDDDYTEVEADRQTDMSGTIGTATAAVANTYIGFTLKSPIEQKTIALNNTVVNIYYDRITYTIIWDVKLNGVQEAYKEETLRYGAMPSYGADPTKEQSESQVFTFSGWTPNPYAVDKAQTYKGSFNVAARPYTITFVNDNGEQLQSSEVGYGNTPVYEGATPVSTIHPECTFIGWTPEITLVGGVKTYTATYNCAVDPIVVVADETKTVAINTTTTTTTVKVKGTLNVNTNVTLKTNDLILEGTPNSSGEILGAGTVTATHAYFDFSNGAEGFKARTWYAVAVPWQVAVPAYEKANNGVYIKKGSGEFVQQELGRSFDLIYYDGAKRAAEGHSDDCWKYVEDDINTEHIMYPGRAYMIYFTSNAQTIRFERKEGATIQTTTLAVETYDLGTGNSKDANWNGIANPATYHAYINANVKDYTTETMNVGQVYNAETRTYSVVDMDANNLVVGQPIFVQATAANPSVEAYRSHDDAFHAPRRAKAEESMTRYELYLAPSMDVATDRIIVRMSEDKETDEYIVGQDLAKMGVSSLVPQMWVDRYDSKMCINTAIPTDDQAYYPLGISVPQNGEYDIFLDDEPDSESTLYLTYDGEVIWNLSYGFYVAHLEKGTNTHYGLRIVKTPKVATGIDNAETSGKDINVYKIIVDDKVFIIRGNQVYGIDGRLAK